MGERPTFRITRKLDKQLLLNEILVALGSHQDINPHLYVSGRWNGRQVCLTAEINQNELTFPNMHQLGKEFAKQRLESLSKVTLLIKGKLEGKLSSSSFINQDVIVIGEKDITDGKDQMEIFSITVNSSNTLGLKKFKVNEYEDDIQLSIIDEFIRGFIGGEGSKK